MPELPDVTVYVEALTRRLPGQRLADLRLVSPFFLRSTDVDPASLAGHAVREISRLGKRIVLTFDNGCVAVIHLMIAGRFRWLEGNRKPPGKITLAVFEFETARLAVTEAGTRKRASLHLLASRDDLKDHDPGGAEPLECSRETFGNALLSQPRTLKRALTNPRQFSGIGNAYSDEILHAAGLSPWQRVANLTPAEIDRLFDATRRTLLHHYRLLHDEVGEAFPRPAQITAFRPAFAVHGKFGEPCPVCGTTVQRIVFAENECNYCPTCQTGGRVLADRALSRLLKDDWPRTVDELE